MRSHKVLCVVVTLAAATTLAAQDLPYAGKWKMNPAKSDFGQTTTTYEQLPSGEMQSTAAGQTYKFNMDGKDYPALFGGTAAWTSLGPSSWKTVWKLSGKVMTTDTLTLSADGKTLTVRTTGTKPNGDAMDDTLVAERASGGPGLSGKWKAKNLKSSSPNVLEIAASGSDGLTFRIVDLQLTCEAKFDGKDHPCTGPTIGEGWTVMLAKQGARGLDMTVKNNGKAMFQASYTVSADGKTLTESSTAMGANEKTTVVYDRQSGS